MTFQEYINDYLGDRDSGTEGYDKTILDANHFARRMFRCWLDGSYLGEEHYRVTCDSARTNYNNDTKLRMIVIKQFCDFIAFEFDCCISTAQRATVKTITDLEALNVELIDDLRDLVRDEMEVA